MREVEVVEEMGNKVEQKHLVVSSLDFEHNVLE